MKRCPFCAEDIQDAAIVCKHCGREVKGIAAAAVAPDTSKKSGRLLWWVGGIGIAVVVLAAIGANPPDGPTNANILQVTAAKGPGGFTLTNREDEAITECEVTVLDEGDDEWTATSKDYLNPRATTSMPWSSFKNKGQSMPAYIGVNRNNFIVRCSGTDGRSRSAGVRF